MIRFLLVLNSLFAYTSFKAVQLYPERPYLMILVALVFFILLIGPMLLGRFRSQEFDTKWFKTLTWVGYTMMGWWGTYIMISLPLDIVELILSLFQVGKTFFTQTTHLAVFIASLSMVAIGFIEVLRGPRVVEVDVPLDSLPPSLADLTIAQISDLHIGPTIQTPYVEKVVRKTNDAHPDIIVITGDLVDAPTESIKKHLLPLGQLKSKYGVFYVTGNHEYYWGMKTLFSELEKVGMTILQNNNKVIEINGASILLAGIPDPTGGQFLGDHKPDVPKARSSPQKTDVNILLAHRPDPYESAEKQGFHLQFSGHTHAGQFFPFSLLIPIAHKYYRGLNRHGKMWLYVNPGTGYWGPANRFGIASEITLAKLVPSKH